MTSTDERSVQLLLSGRNNNKLSEQVILYKSSSRVLDKDNMLSGTINPLFGASNNSDKREMLIRPNSN